MYGISLAFMLNAGDLHRKNGVSISPSSPDLYQQTGAILGVERGSNKRCSVGKSPASQLLHLSKRTYN